MLSLGLRPLKFWGFVADITNEFILGLDIMGAYGAPIDIGRQTLRLAVEELLLWSPGAGPHPSSLLLQKDHVIPAWCEETIVARFARQRDNNNVGSSDLTRKFIATIAEITHNSYNTHFRV
jgi:hypothetical protein